jgi:osmoprotectant transport system permease protein
LRRASSRRLPATGLALATLVALLLLAVGLVAWSAESSAEESTPRPVVIGSKKFTESVILGETLRLLALDAGHPARHRAELGGTRILWGALLSGEIDIYPEYSGTLVREILADEDVSSPSCWRRRSRPAGCDHRRRWASRTPTRSRYPRLGGAARPATHLRPARASGPAPRLQQRVSGSRRRLAGLRQRYRLPQTRVQGLDHDLVYRGIDAGHLDVTVVYTTDAEIARYGLRMLEDDLGYFEDYQAILLYRAELAERRRRRRRLSPSRRRDRRIHHGGHERGGEAGGRSEQTVAARLLSEGLGLEVAVSGQGFWSQLGQRTLEHLGLVGVSLGAAILFAVPLGVLAAQQARLGHLILGITGMIQTIPSLALFVFLIPWLGIGWLPTVVALFLYSLLPIVRNTHAGLMDIPVPIRESADVLGLTRGARLRLIELPLAANTILAGIKTSAVLNVGTATVAALIGAGGYGQPILTGIRLDDTALIMQGAVPAALLALGLQGLFEFAERWVVPRGLRLKPTDGGRCGRGSLTSSTPDMTVPSLLAAARTGD